VANVFAGGWAAARGPARPLFTGLAVFVAGLLIVGAAPTMAWFIAGRAVQGLGSGLASVPLYVVVARVYPEQSQPKIFAAMAGAWVVPSLVGPSIGGLVAQHFGWRWVFLGIVPLVVPAALALAPTVRGLRADGAVPRGRTLTAVALAAGAALLLWGLDHRSVFALLAALAGLAGVGYGVRVLMPRGLARLRRGLPTVIAMRGLLLGAMSGTEAFTPLALTTRFGFHPTTAGLVLTAGAIGWSAGSWWQGRFVVAGAALQAVGIAGVALSFHVSGWLTLPAWIVAGVGIGTAVPALSVLVLRLSGPDAQGTNSSAMQISDTLGSSLAVGIAGALVNAAGLNTGAACTAVIAIVAALAAHRVESSHA
jgi:MFS family permease